MWVYKETLATRSWDEEWVPVGVGYDLEHKYFLISMAETHYVWVLGIKPRT